MSSDLHGHCSWVRRGQDPVKFHGTPAGSPDSNGRALLYYMRTWLSGHADGKQGVMKK